MLLKNTKNFFLVSCHGYDRNTKKLFANNIFLESDGAKIQTNHILMIYFVPTHRPRSEQKDKECFAANDHIWNIW